MPDLNVNVRHIDTCLSCYLLDHHTRPGEVLLGIPIDGASTYAQLREDLENEVSGYTGDVPEGWYDAARAAIAEQFSTVPDTAVPFDPNVDLSEEDENEGDFCQAWFLFTWDAESNA